MNPTVEETVRKPGPPGPRRVLVPLSLTEADKASILCAVAKAGSLQAEVILLHVVAPFYQMTPWMPPMVWHGRYTDEITHEAAQHTLGQLAKRLIPTTQPWILLITEGNIFTRIIDAARELNPILMILAPPHERPLLSRVLFGNLHRRIQRASPCRIEVAAEGAMPRSGLN